MNLMTHVDAWRRPDLDHSSPPMPGSTDAAQNARQ